MPTDTFQIAASGDDSDVFRYGTDPAVTPTSVRTWQPTAADVWVARAWDGANYYVTNGLLRFNTAAIPDTAAITAATLRLYPTALPNADGRSLTAEYYVWDGVSDSDWSEAAVSSAMTGVTIASLTLNQFNDLPLTSVSGITSTGYTYLRLHISGGQPTGNNYVSSPQWDHTTDSANRAQLDVTYTLAATTRIAPDAILVQTNLTGAVSAIQDDPDSADANWLTAP